MATIPLSSVSGTASLVSMVSNMPRSEKTGEPRFSLLLGAGASVSSGVPQASTLINGWKQTVFLGLIRQESMTPALRHEFNSKWLREAPEAVTISIADGVPLKIPNYAMWRESIRERHPGDYSLLFSRIHQDADTRQGFIETLCSPCEPGAGYVYLSSLVRDNIFRTILTTNFDDLIHDAIFRYAGIKPLVCAFDSQVSTIRLTSPRPKVIKLHGDFLYSSIKNVGAEMARLDVNMRQKFEQTSANYGIIVLGYSGGDQSVMDPIGAMLTRPDYFGHGLHWCVYTSEQDVEANRVKEWNKRELTIPDEVKRLHTAYPERVHVYSVGTFDEVMGALYRGCECDPPDDLVKPEMRSSYVRLREAITNAEMSYQLETPFRELLTKFRVAQSHEPHSATLDLDAADSDLNTANQLKNRPEPKQETERATHYGKIVSLYEDAVRKCDKIAGAQNSESVEIAAHDSKPTGRPDSPPAKWYWELSAWLHRRRSGALTGAAEFIYRKWIVDNFHVPYPLKAEDPNAEDDVRKKVKERNEVRECRRTAAANKCHSKWFKSAESKDFIRLSEKAWRDCKEGWALAVTHKFPPHVTGHIRNFAYNGLLACAYLDYEGKAIPEGDGEEQRAERKEQRDLCVRWVRHLLSDRAFGEQYLKEIEKDINGKDFLVKVAQWDTGTSSDCAEDAPGTSAAVNANPDGAAKPQ